MLYPQTRRKFNFGLIIITTLFCQLETNSFTDFGLSVCRTVKDKVLKLCDKAPQFKKVFSHPQAYRTSNALDRLMNYQDRILYSIQYFHGHATSVLLYLRSMAMIWNFHPYSTRARYESACASPFESLNGFQYHSNWLQNMLVAGSLRGWRV
jgi:hypothetical protein